MRRIHAFFGEKGLVGRNQRQVHGVGQRQQFRLDRGFLAHALAADLDIETVAEDRLEPVAGRFRRIALPGREIAPERSAQAAGQCNQALGKGLDGIARHMGRRACFDGQKGLRGQLQQIAVAGLVLRQQDKLIETVPVSPVRLRRFEGNRELAADDRLDAGPGAGLGKFQGAEQVVGVRDRHRRHPVGFAQRGYVWNFERAFGQRIGGMNPEVDKIGVVHRRSGAVG